MTAPWRSVVLLLRSFTRARGFAVAAVLVVALGVGANAVVFSMFDRVLFRPLPYGEPDRLVQLQTGLHLTSDHPIMPVAVTRALARETGLFSGIGWAMWGSDLTPLTPVAGENPLLLLTGVTTGTLDVLGVRPVIGPGFSAMQATELARPVLLTYETWQRKYGGSEDVLSLEWMIRDARQRDIHWRVVGVLPEGFLLPSPKPVPGLYDAIYGVDDELDGPILRTDFVTVAPFARLSPGVSMAAARARINAVVATWFPRDPSVQRVSVVPLQSGLSTVTRPYVWLAVIGAWAVLVATSLTLAILLLTWSQSRRQDAGVRLALGASPRRLVVSTLAESVVICSAGAVIGWLVYVWTRSAFVALMPAGLRPFAVETGDVRVIVVTGAIALVSALVAGTLPALRAARTSPLQVMRGQQDATHIDRLVGGPVLLSAQAALGVMLLVGALTILPGVLRALAAPPGFDATDLFTASVPTANDATASDAREQTRRGLAALAIARQLPGVVDAALSRRDPFRPSAIEWQVLRGELRNRHGFEGFIRPVDADFFRLLHVPLRAGRAVSHADVEEQALVAVINETGARAQWPGLLAADAVGRVVTTEDGSRVIVGVAADFRVGIDTSVEPTLFLPLSASEAYYSPGSAFPWNEYQVLMRMAPGRVPDTVLLSDRVREQPWMISNWLGRVTADSVDAELDVALETPRLLALIFGTLAGIALLLTVVAMYGLASFEIRRRREEMTVRLALGATPRALRRRLAVAIVRPVLIGILGGLPFSWVIARLLSISVAVGNANDVRIYAVATIAIVIAALLAAWLPGRRLFTMRVAELLRQ